MLWRAGRRQTASFVQGCCRCRLLSFRHNPLWLDSAHADCGSCVLERDAGDLHVLHAFGLFAHPQLAAQCLPLRRIDGLPSSTIRHSSPSSEYRWPRRPWMIWSLHSSRVTLSLCCSANDSVFVMGSFRLEWTTCGGLALRTYQMALVSTGGSTRYQQDARAAHKCRIWLLEERIRSLIRRREKPPT